MDKFRPGEVVPHTCHYKAIDEQGNNGGRLWLEKGQRFPATQHSGSYYMMDHEGDDSNYGDQE